MKTLDDFVPHIMQKLFDSEQLSAPLSPQVASGVDHDFVIQAVEAVVGVVRSHMEASRSVFTDFGQEVQDATCEAILDLLKEVEEVMAEMTSPGPVRDAGLIACVLAIQHYSVARYGTLLAWAQNAGRTKAVEALSEALRQAQQCAHRLLDLGGGGVARTTRVAQA